MPLDVITQANVLGITQSHFEFTIKQEDKWEGECSTHKDVKDVKWSREMPWSRPNTIYRCPQTNRAVRAREERPAYWPDTQVGGDRPQALSVWSSDSRHVFPRAMCSHFKYRSFDSNGNKTVRALVNCWPDTPLCWLEAVPRGVRSFPETILSMKKVTECVRSRVTWHSATFGPHNIRRARPTSVGPNDELCSVRVRSSALALTKKWPDT
jgi:hypothetical protein